jgi:hypothetical protein
LSCIDLPPTGCAGSVQRVQVRYQHRPERRPVGQAQLAARRHQEGIRQQVRVLQVLRDLQQEGPAYQSQVDHRDARRRLSTGPHRHHHQAVLHGGGEQVHSNAAGGGAQGQAGRL